MEIRTGVPGYYNTMGYTRSHYALHNCTYRTLTALVLVLEAWSIIWLNNCPSASLSFFTEEANVSNRGLIGIPTKCDFTKSPCNQYKNYQVYEFIVIIVL